MSGGLDDLDPDIRRFQQQVAASYARYPAFASLPLPERRRIAEEVRAIWAAGGPEMWKIEEFRIAPGGVRIRIYRPDECAMAPALLYIHGGGWTMFSLDTHDRLMREYAARARIVVIGVDYSLSPEAKFPTALDEIHQVVRWLRAHGAAHGVDAARLAIGGDSAGANMSVATALRLRSVGEPPLAAMLLNYGAFDSSERPSYRRYDGDAYNLTAAEMAGFRAGYVRDEADLNDPLVSPIRADLTGLPPAFLAVAECDILVDENLDMGRKFAEAGVETEVRVYPGAAHSFLEAVSISPLADRALAEESAWLNDRLAGPAVLLVGCGRMGGALMRGWQGRAEMFVHDPATSEAPGAMMLPDLVSAASLPRPLTVVLAVKPAVVPQALAELLPIVGEDVLFLSIAAGVRIENMQALLGGNARIVRAMPNTPASVGRGISAAVAGSGVSEAQRSAAGTLLGAVGEVVWLDDEADLDAVTAVSGSGPAYFFRFAEALAAAGEVMGLDPTISMRLARATLVGAGAVAAERTDSLAELRVEVTSPGGTTAAALAAFDAGALDGLVGEAVEAAGARSRELVEGRS
jgi:acetyl esterase